MSPSKTQAESFKALVAGLREALREPEQFTLSYAAESSAFVRFNHARVRQAGQVQQASIGLKLINEGRHADLAHHPGWRPGGRLASVCPKACNSCAKPCRCCPRIRTCC